MKITHTLRLTIASALLLAGSIPVLHAAEDLTKKEPADILDVMEWAHKGRESTAAKVRDGKGTKDEVATLLRFYQFMAKQKPPQGDDASWKEKTAALVAAAEKLKKGDVDGVETYKKAVNCKACHDVHKPKDE